jgi:hypothetical protein
MVKSFTLNKRRSKIMKRLVRELNERAIELDSKIENAKTPDSENWYSGKLMEVERIMRSLIESGDAELDDQSEKLLALELADQEIMQIKAVHYKIRESR